uniref:Uncharacterized protein n=1 Tax=Tanacetum cinerariifolium TaxID=118510 RepID=A0A699GVR0_TANCI|nr:hypothetical protein [Tanacetum cinerariifolium]
MQTQTSNALHNAIIEAGGKDRPPMLAQGSSETTTERYMENYKNVSQDIRDQLNAEAEAAKDASYHKEKILLCKQEEAGFQLNAKQADWRDDTNDELDDRGSFRRLTTVRHPKGLRHHSSTPQGAAVVVYRRPTATKMVVWRQEIRSFISSTATVVANLPPTAHHDGGDVDEMERAAVHGIGGWWYRLWWCYRWCGRRVTESDAVDLVDRGGRSILGFAEKSHRKSFPGTAAGGGRLGREREECQGATSRRLIRLNRLRLNCEEMRIETSHRRGFRQKLNGKESKRQIYAMCISERIEGHENP